MKHMAENSRFVRNSGEAEYFQSIFEAAGSHLMRCLENPNSGCLVCGYQNGERQDIKIRMFYYPTEWE